MSRKLVRRIVAAVLVLTGAWLLWLSPETVYGTVMFVAGIGLEALGVRLDHV